MKIRACPDCGSIRTLSETGEPKDARCMVCDAPMDPTRLQLKYLGGLIVVVLLVIAGAWIVLAGLAPRERLF